MAKACHNSDEEVILTGPAVYELGASGPLVQCCIPPHLIASLPRPSWIHGVLTLQTWYFRTDKLTTNDFWAPCFYLAQNVWVEDVVEMKAFTWDTAFPQSNMTMFYNQIFREQEIYLKQLAAFLNREEYEENVLSELQRLWFKYQTLAVKNWADQRPELPRYLRRVLLSPRLSMAPEQLLAAYC